MKAAAMGLSRAFDLTDVAFAAGMVMLASGLVLVSMSLALIVSGGTLLYIVLWHRTLTARLMRASGRNPQ